jgi:hypothetical protein
MSCTRGVRRRRRRLIAATSSAAGASAEIEDLAHLPGLDPRRKTLLDELGERRTRNQHALIDVESQPREPGFVSQVRQRHAFDDAAFEQRRDLRSLRGAGPATQHAGRRVVRQLHGVENQRRRLVTCIVGAMTEEHARLAQTSLHAGDEFACSARGLRMK